MPSAQLKETTMSRKNRTLLQVIIPESKTEETKTIVNELMGKKSELRLAFIQKNASFAANLDI